MKARAYMRYKKVPMVEVEATPQVRQSIIGPRTGQQFIPVLITPDDATVIQDTSDIIDFIESKHPNPPLYDLDRKEFPLRAWANHMIEAWSDEFMVPYAMSFRWTRKDQRNHIYYEFGRLALSGQPLPGPGRLDKYLEVGGKMGDSFSAGSLFGQGISTMGADAVESHFVKQILTPLSHHLTGTPYLLGNYPSLGDFSMNGGLYGHIYRDPASSGMLKLQAPPVADWIERVAGLAPARSEPVRIMCVSLLSIASPTTGH